LLDTAEKARIAHRLIVLRENGFGAMNVAEIRELADEFGAPDTLEPGTGGHTIARVAKAVTRLSDDDDSPVDDDQIDEYIGGLNGLSLDELRAEKARLTEQNLKENHPEEYEVTLQADREAAAAAEKANKRMRMTGSWEA